MCACLSANEGLSTTGVNEYEDYDHITSSQHPPCSTDSSRGIGPCVRRDDSTSDESRCLLRDGDDGCIGVAPHDRRHHRGVDDAQAVDAFDLQLRIDHPTDAAGAGRMVEHLSVLLDIGPD